MRLLLRMFAGWVGVLANKKSPGIVLVRFFLIPKSIYCIENSKEKAERSFWLRGVFLGYNDGYFFFLVFIVDEFFI